MSWDDYKKTMVTPPSEQLGAAAKRNDVPELERLLLEEGVALDGRDVRGYSPLMMAAYSGSRDALLFLLRAGADPESADFAGNSVLMGAAFKGHVDMVKDLLAVGADPRRKNDAGLDARGFAEMFGRVAVLEILDGPHGAATGPAMSAMSATDQ